MANSEQVSSKRQRSASAQSSGSLQPSAVRPITVRPKTVRPIGVYKLSGLATDGGRLLAVDTVRGYVVEVIPETDATTILYPHAIENWVGSSGLAIWQDTLWAVRDRYVFCCDTAFSVATVFAELPYDANGVAVWEDKVYVNCEKAG